MKIMGSLKIDPVLKLLDVQTCSSQGLNVHINYSLENSTATNENQLKLQSARQIKLYYKQVATLL
jgi:hypothetical protein